MELDSGPRHSIIIVDNDTNVSNLLAGYFTLAKFRVIKTTSATECIDKLKEFENKIDIVFMDGKIASDRGAMLIINIKKLSSSIKIFALADNENNKTRVLDYGADEFATKPISPTTIVEKASALLRKEPAEAK
ncbi:MAG TPA: response regulator [Nitrososphaeraceae archaeon]|nr:response regulator [Nitrososphaeraceae archaeon]